ncbi:MAG: RdgB/HAM1 family non-canonical purine NTP pyrophosphatase [Chlorobiales bacterium]|nr:RdgB/HAM1 family non-canonical purine NTP pyrophosphatase [Chlorobiales bacterium]
MNVLPAQTALVLATHNRDKIAEIKPELLMLASTLVVLSLDDFPDFPEVDETEATLEGNALKKARETFSHVERFFKNVITLADDTGLEVDALGGAPGVYSARFAETPGGRKPTYDDNMAKLLDEMKGTENRNARFRTVIALAGRTNFGKNQEALYFEKLIDASVSGEITKEKQGEQGFGYDPVFFVKEIGKTFAELSISEKNRISHRGKAVRKAAEYLVDAYCK